MTRASMPPRISVVLPVWNGERYLAEAIDSVLAQTYREFELVIVDDGSDDRSREIIAQYAARDGRVRPIHAAHRGLVATLNDGCRAARGEFIVRTDADDIALPERLEQQLAFLACRPGVALVAGALQVIDPAGQPLPQPFVEPPTDDAVIRVRLAEANCFIHSTVMMRRDAWNQVGGYRALYAEAEDYDLWTRLAEQYELAGMRTAVALYRVHPLQVSVIRLEQQALVAQVISLATGIRWRTGVDPLAGCQAITRETARSLGASDDAIDRHLMGAYLRCIGGLPTLGLTRLALDVLRETMTSRLLTREFERRFPGSTGSAGAAGATGPASASHQQTAVLTP